MSSSPASSRKRPASSGNASGASQANAGSAGVLRFYNDDAPGLKIGPTTVLISSLLFIGAVVIFHILGKVSGGGGAAAS